MPNGNKMYQMATKRPTSSIARLPKIYPNWNFWFENKPSGNPGLCARVDASLSTRDASNEELQRGLDVSLGQPAFVSIYNCNLFTVVIYSFYDWASYVCHML
jgi:hypothetical protein